MAVLTDESLVHVVDLVAFVDGDEIEVRNSRGASRFARSDPSAGATLVEGRDPIANTDPLALSPLTAELASPHATNAQNAYPWARERLADLLADPRAPDIVVVHTPAHYWPERGGHLGEHGSLDVLQSRAPLLLSGAGVSASGVLDR
ncbi:MAG: nucleotide pyrophosphatase, partial [Frankia sp.]|nr:nucleotide pyrophosphatase [Frankia sp.]